MGPPDRWLVLTAHTPEDDPLRDLVVEGLLALGGMSVLESRDELTTYLPPPDDPEGWIREASHFLEEWLGDEAPALGWRWQPNEDWEREWRRGLEPRKVSPRLVVKPSWTGWTPAPGEIVVQIDPQMAFGTGEHATTRSCLRLLDEVLTAGDRVLDVGSGSGILGIAAALLGASEVIAIEADPDANLNAHENLALNGVADRIVLREQVADAPLLAALGRFDLILANILSSVILPLLPTFAGALAPGGRLIVSGILDREREGIVAAAESAGLRVTREVREEEWWSAALREAAGAGNP